MKKIIFLILLTLSLVEARPTFTVEVEDILQKTEQEISSVSSKELKKLIKNDEVILIDLRRKQEWDNGVINTNKLVKLQRGLLEFKYQNLILNKYTKDDKFVLYCKDGPRSILATKTLNELGFKNVSYLKGGYVGWEE